MNALTICQPHAYYIALPESDPMHKRVENRTWGTNYRGPLAIHAGKSRAWLPSDLGQPDCPFVYTESDLVFGAVVAIGELVECIHLPRFVARVEANRRAWAEQSIRRHQGHKRTPLPFEWILDHRHTEGPWCWVLDDVRLLVPPVPATGAQGLWEWRRS